MCICLRQENDLSASENFASSSMAWIALIGKSVRRLFDLVPALFDSGKGMPFRFKFVLVVASYVGLCGKLPSGFGEFDENSRTLHLQPVD